MCDGVLLLSPCSGLLQKFMLCGGFIFIHAFASFPRHQQETVQRKSTHSNAKTRGEIGICVWRERKRLKLGLGEGFCSVTANPVTEWQHRRRRRQQAGTASSGERQQQPDWKQACIFPSNNFNLLSPSLSSHTPLFSISPADTLTLAR